MNDATDAKGLRGPLSVAALLLSACQLVPVSSTPRTQAELFSDASAYLWIDRAEQREYFKARVLSVDRLERGGWALSFERSSRYHYIHEERSPNAEQMVDRAREALEDEGQVFVTIDVSPSGADREGRVWVPVVLWLGDSPDPGRPQG